MKIVSVVAFCIALAAPGLAQPPASMTKSQIYAELHQLAGAKAASERARYDELSAFLGGDRPGQSTPRAGGAAPLGGVVAPPNCTATATVVSNTTPTPIPDGPGGVASNTVTVAGAAPYLWQASLVVDITHTFAGDLDITLTSPGATVVTLTTDNGGGNDNVFSTVTWTDAALTPTTDAVYANLTPVGMVVPEEAMGAFQGEDPNGLWTLTVTDDAGVDIGTINGWTLSITSIPVPTTVATLTFTNSTPTAIPDGPGGVVVPTLAVSGVPTFLCSVDLDLDLTHTFAGDLDITLSAGGTPTTLTTDNGGGNDNVFAGTLFDDDGGTPASDFVYANLVTATPLVPEGALNHFAGVDPNAIWSLSVTDDAGVDIGTINSWSLDVTTCECAIPEADLALAKSVAPTSAAPGDNVVFTLIVTNNGPGSATNTVVVDSLPAAFTYVSNDCAAGFAAPTLTWNVGTLANGASATCNVTVTVNGPGSNNASATADQTDTVPANNSAAAAVSVNVLAIPTAGSFGLLVLALGLGLAAVHFLRRRG